MIVGAFIRYIKTYQGMNYIPLTDSDQFCGIVGNNGVGKSSILEALDCFFNDKTWNLNNNVKKHGLSRVEPLIVPVFMIKKDEISSKYHKIAQALTNAAFKINSRDVNSSQSKTISNFVKHRDKLATYTPDFDEYYLLPLGDSFQDAVAKPISVGYFNNKVLVSSVQAEFENLDEIGIKIEDNTTHFEQEQLDTIFKDLRSDIKSKLEYIYIPREIDPEHFTKLETDEIQVLMGEKLTDILSRLVPERKVQEINASLKEFIDSVGEELVEYAYRNPGLGQKNFKRQDLYELIIQAFFSIRKLHRKQGEGWLEINQLSSGEKQKAIIDVAHGFLTHHRSHGKNLIIGIDEPESSLHMSSCYDQFDALYEISRISRQLIFTTHWYGFLPTAESGCASIITREDQEHRFDIINLSSYKEEIKQMVRNSQGKLPFDIKLKSTTDFVQSVISSTLSETPFNWLICEGSSEKIYLNQYLKDLVKSKRLRIVPVGGAAEISRLYAHFATAYDDFKGQFKGKIVLLSDTDEELVTFETKQHTHLISKRMVLNSGGEVILIENDRNPKSPATEIEDVLDGKAFVRTFLDHYSDEKQIIDAIEGKETDESGKVSRHLLNLRPSETELLKEFFDRDGANHKFKFAQNYVKTIEGDEYNVPDWVKQLRSYFD
ncbi:AAA family ATPase [Vibrio alginolyticus]|nr:AAA family ATPase [Vibrio alginolyticus]